MLRDDMFPTSDFNAENCDAINKVNDEMKYTCKIYVEEKNVTTLEEVPIGI